MTKPKKNPVGRPRGTKLPKSKLRVNFCLKLRPTVVQNIRKKPKGFLRKFVEAAFK